MSRFLSLRWLVRALAALCLLALLLVVGAGAWYYRARHLPMPTATPAEAGIDAVLLARAADAIAGSTDALLVVRGGRLVHEQYPKSWWLGPLAEIERQQMASMSKAVVGATTVAMGLCDGWLDLDRPLGQIIPDLRPELRGLTSRELGHHVSGLADAPFRAEIAAWGPVYWQRLDRRARIALDTVPVVAPPDRVVLYSNPGFTLLGIALAALRHSEPLAPALRARVMRPLGIPDDGWKIAYDRRLEAGGITYEEIAGGARYTPRALARIGAMILGRGSVEGRAVLDGRCVDAILQPDLAARRVVAGDPLAPASGDPASTAPVVPADLGPVPAPAIGWWSNADGTWPDLPRDLLVAAGAEHAVVAVVPSRDLVVVRVGTRLGRDLFGGDYWPALHDRLLRPLLDAVTPGA